MFFFLEIPVTRTVKIENENAWKKLESFSLSLSLFIITIGMEFTVYRNYLVNPLKNKKNHYHSETKNSQLKYIIITERRKRVSFSSYFAFVINCEIVFFFGCRHNFNNNNNKFIFLKLCIVKLLYIITGKYFWKSKVSEKK